MECEEAAELPQSISTNQRSNTCSFDFALLRFCMNEFHRKVVCARTKQSPSKSDSINTQNYGEWKELKSESVCAVTRYSWEHSWGKMMFIKNLLEPLTLFLQLKSSFFGECNEKNSICGSTMRFKWFCVLASWFNRKPHRSYVNIDSCSNVQ